MAAIISCGDRKGEGLSANGTVKTDGIQWHNLVQGMETAKKEGKPVFLFFYTDWCVYCKKMDKEVFSDSDVISYMSENFISIRINPENDSSTITVMGRPVNASQLMSLSGARGYPSLMFWDRKQQPVTTIPGYVEKKTFLPMLKYMDAECYLKDIYLDDYIAGRAVCGNK